MTTYTASEMREVADVMEAQGDNWNSAGKAKAAASFHIVAQMLRQAADAMEKDERRKSLDELTALSQELGLYDIQRPK